MNALSVASAKLDAPPIAFSRPFFGDAEAEAAAAVVRSGWVVGGPRLAEFEQRFARLCGADHAVGVSSWTTGAFLVLHAWGIGPGDEVIVPSLTFVASVNVIRTPAPHPYSPKSIRQPITSIPPTPPAGSPAARARSCRSISS